MKWDANWDRLKSDTKINKIRIRLNEIKKYIDKAEASARADFSTALYVANLNR